VNNISATLETDLQINILNVKDKKNSVAKSVSIETNFSDQYFGLFRD
jgi:hypothetical protein